MNDSTAPLAAGTLAQTLADTLELQRKAYLAHPVPTLAERKPTCARCSASCARTRRSCATPSAPTTATARATRPCWPRSSRSIDGVDHTLKHLGGWMKPQRRGVDLRISSARATA